ncbi:MAG: CHASE2 domain-containing protein, partial [Candidatus Eremiobacteraeota bacterium]|nr:CHASE2 domain-containing protein [Candidatus Eremiobacteraeota bacterium]
MITLLLIVVRIGFGVTEPDRFEGLNDQLADTLWVLRNHLGRGPSYDLAADEVAVVLIDVPSLRASPETWPWTPSTFAEFINMTLDVGKAKGLLLDVPFRGLTNEDRQVREALTRPGVVYGAQAYSDENNRMVIEAPLARPTVEGDDYATQTFGMTAVYTGNDKVVRDVMLNLPMRVLEPGSDKQEVVFVTALCLQAAAEVMNAPRSEIDPHEDQLTLHPRSASGVKEQPFAIPLYKGRFPVNYSFSDQPHPKGTQVAPGVY